MRDTIDESTSGMVAGAAFHWYSGDHFGALDLVRQQYPDLKLITSESCIYVKNLTPPADASQPQTELDQVPSSEPQTVEDQQQFDPLDNSAVKTAPFEQSAPLEMRGQDCGFCVPNKTDMNNTDSNYTDTNIQ